MTQEIEIEYKNLLTKKEYDRLLEQLPFPSQGKKQINYYFETTDFALKARGSALRIREKDGKYQLTLKEPHPDGLLETHDWLSKSEAKHWLSNEIIPKKNTETQLLKMGISSNQLKYCGNLTTIRRELHYQDVLLVLDYSSYNGQEDYELELEASSQEAGIRMFYDVLEQYAIQQRKTPNKIERFFFSLKK